MHNALHTAMPHACTYEQQQQLSESSSNNGSDSSDDSNSNDSGIRGNSHWFSMATFSNVNPTAFAAEVLQL